MWSIDQLYIELGLGYNYFVWISEKSKFGISFIIVSAESIGIGAETETLFFPNFTQFFLLLGRIQVFISLKMNQDLQK